MILHSAKCNITIIFVITWMLMTALSTMFIELNISIDNHDCWPYQRERETIIEIHAFYTCTWIFGLSDLFQILSELCTMSCTDAIIFN